MKGKRSFSIPVGVIYSWETAHLIQCGMEGGLWCPHLGVPFMQNSSASPSICGRGDGEKMIQMRDTSEDSTGCRGDWTQRRAQASQREGTTILQSGCLFCLLPSSPHFCYKLYSVSLVSWVRKCESSYISYFYITVTKCLRGGERTTFAHCFGDVSPS